LACRGHAKTKCGRQIVIAESKCDLVRGKQYERWDFGETMPKSKYIEQGGNKQWPNGFPK
jgi:hypothetical protein